MPNKNNSNIHKLTESTNNNSNSIECNVNVNELSYDNSNLSFSQRLAHNSLKVRENSIRKLIHWLKYRKNIELLDLLKIWKGLFYCYWMSDKSNIQLELANKITNILLTVR